MNLPMIILTNRAAKSGALGKRYGKAKWRLGDFTQSVAGIEFVYLDHSQLSWRIESLRPSIIRPIDVGKEFWLRREPSRCASEFNVPGMQDKVLMG